MSIDLENDILLLTAASGKQCSALLPLVYPIWERRLRLVVKSDSSQKSLQKQYPLAAVIQADLSLSKDARAVMTGVTTVLYIGPPMHSHETEMGYTVIDAACKDSELGRVKHFIYSSVLHPQLRKLMNHDCKRYVEEYLIESGLNYTIVQPSHILDTLPVQELLQQDKPVFPAKFDPKVTYSFTILKDLAEAFSTVIEEREKHYLAEYMVCSTGPVSYEEVIETLSKETNRPIKIEQQDYFESTKGFQNMIAGDDGDVSRTTRDAIQRMLLYYNFYGIKGNTNVLEWLIGRKPTTVKDFLSQKVLDCQGS